MATKAQFSQEELPLAMLKLQSGQKTKRGDMPTREKPILFSGEMIRAILSGTKRQTRRIVKPQPTEDGNWWVYSPNKNRQLSWGCEVNSVFFANLSPYGTPGDLLWVKETWYTHEALDIFKPTELTKSQHEIFYFVDYPGICHAGRLRPSIFMRRWMSRITLELTAVRIERLQDISEADAKAEGVAESLFGAPYKGIGYQGVYRHLWNHINGVGAWDKNPWVWVLEFKRITP
jgi:hypothetical protein